MSRITVTVIIFVLTKLLGRNQDLQEIDLGFSILGFDSCNYHFIILQIANYKNSVQFLAYLLITENYRNYNFRFFSAHDVQYLCSTVRASNSYSCTII